MIIAEYLGKLWIHQTLEELNTEFNYLISRGCAYVEVKEYFRKNYGIAVSNATYESADDGVKLTLYLKDNEIDAATAYLISPYAKIGIQSYWDDEYHETISNAYISIPINQIVEQL